MIRLHRKASSARSKNVGGSRLLSKSENILALEVGESSFQTLDSVDFGGTHTFTRLEVGKTFLKRKENAA